MLAGDLLAAPTPEVVGAEFHHIRHQVVAFDDKVFDDLYTVRRWYLYHPTCMTYHVDSGIRHFNSGNRNVTGRLEDLGDYDVEDILHEMRLEDRLAVLILAQVLE